MPLAGGEPLDIGTRRTGKEYLQRAYKKAEDVQALFESLTGLRIKDAQLEPKVVI